MEKHLNFLVLLTTSGFYLYRSFEKESELVFSFTKRAYRFCMLSNIQLSPVIYEIPTD